MQTSGETAIATTNDAAVVLISADAAKSTSRATIINDGGEPGFWSMDAGKTYARLPAGPCVINLEGDIDEIRVKRVPSGANVTGLWAFAY